jgi:tetratricopeptide (TPR) repeat protein
MPRTAHALGLCSTVARIVCHRLNLICRGACFTITTWRAWFGSDGAGRSQSVPSRTWIAFLSFWPGLAQIWSGQETLGLLLSTLFAAALNLAIVTRWIWTEAFALSWAQFFATLAFLTWGASLAHTLWWVWLCHPERHRREIERLFRDALEAYLQGRWNDSRKRIERILALDETDADALMHLGALYVRLQQPALARRAFRQCLELEGGAKWRWEVQHALSRLGDG